MAATSASRPLAEATGLRWSSVVRTGLLSGVVAVYVGLVGLIEALAGRVVITGLLSTGQVILLGVYLLMGYQGAQRLYSSEGKGGLAKVAAGALVGIVTSAILALLVIVGQQINLRAMFINASPRLWELLTFGRGAPAGLLWLLALGAVLGALAGGLTLLPPQWRKAVGLGLVSVPVVSILNTALFAGRGVSIPTAIVIFALITFLSYAWSTQGSQMGSRVNALPSNQQRLLRMIGWSAVALGLLALPLLGPYPMEILDTVGIYVLMGLGLNIVVGFAGLLDLGYVAFFALGAYTIGILTSPEITWLPLQLTWWEALPIAILVGVIAGTLLGIPVLQMRGDYLAIVTLGFGEIIRLVFLSDWLKPLVGGSNGITRIPRALPASAQFADQQMLWYIVLAGILLAAFIATRLKYSRIGRNWMAMREDEDVAQAMGIDLVKTKLLAFATGAGLSAVGGAIFATKLTSIYPHSFNLLVSINVLAVIIVGGLGSIPGVLVGALALVGLPELLREFAEYRLLVYGAVLVYMMLKRPEGLLPEARRKLELHEGEEA